MSPKISTPVEGFTGTVAGVDFIKGEGETEDAAALAYFDRQGYTIHPDTTADTSRESSPRGLTPKQKAQTAAAELGLSTEGTQAEIEQRIADHEKASKPEEDGKDPEENTGDGAENADAKDDGSAA